jgi:hypothetical protein
VGRCTECLRCGGFGFAADKLSLRCTLERFALGGIFAQAYASLDPGRQTLKDMAGNCSRKLIAAELGRASSPVAAKAHELRISLRCGNRRMGSGLADSSDAAER